MQLVGSDEVGSTFAFTPLGVAATNAALDVFVSPGYMERGPYLGNWFQEEVGSWTYPFISQVSSCGTDMCILVDETIPEYPVTGRKIAALCVLKGLLVCSEENLIRLSPPQVLSDDEMTWGIAVLKEAFEEVLEYESVPGEIWTGPE